MTKQFFETIIASGGLAGENFDVAVGPANTGVIDVLLSVGNGALTDNAPLVMRSTGPLGAAQRVLDISAMEQDGRIFILNVENTDISPATNELIITPSVTVNGTAAFAIDEPSHWFFVHTSGGVWFAFRMFTEDDKVVEAARLVRISFALTTWANGTADELKILRTGAASAPAGEIGPHKMDIADTYIVQVYDKTGTPELVNVEVTVDSATGNIFLKKAPLAGDFNGEVIIIGDQ